MKIRVTKDGDAFKRQRSLLQALTIDHGDLAGPVLRRLGQVHRQQQKRIFASQGAEGASGRWPALSPRYRAWKRRVFPGRKILVLSGEMKARFTVPTRPEYIQRFVPRAASRGVYQFGAADDVAVVHFRGIGVPVRDMVTKTASQVQALAAAVIDWYRKERVPQVLRHFVSRFGNPYGVR